MSRPSTLKKDNTLYWVLRTYNTSGVLVDADSTPTVAVRKNGASVADAVTVTKRAATTGIYDCSYNPAGEVEGDQYTLEESATVSAQAYENSWEVKVDEVERGTDSANTVAPDNASITAILADTNELQLNQGNWLTATGFNTVAPDNASITAILADTNELQTNQGNWLTATGFNTVAPDNASITAILADTNELQLNQGNWVTATGFATPADCSTDAEVYAYFTALTRADSFKADVSALATSAALATVDANVDLVLADTSELQTNQGQWLTATGFATPADIAGLNDPTAASIADAVWDEATSGHNAAGSFGKALRQVKEGLVTVESTVNDASATTTSFVTALTEASSSFYSDKVLVFISGQLTGQSRIITSYNGTTKAVTFDEPLSYTPADGDEFIILSMHEHSVSQIADGIWDEPQSGHVTAGTFGAYLDSAVSAAGGGGLTAAAIADAVWDELSSEHIVLGSFGAYIDAAISTVSSSGSGLYQVSVRIQDAALNALQGAYVSIDGTTITLVTDPTGEVTFNLDNGNYTLTVLPPAGYTMPANQGVTVSSADPAQTVFTLSATAASGCDVTWVG